MSEESAADEAVSPDSSKPAAKRTTPRAPRSGGTTAQASKRRTPVRESAAAADSEPAAAADSEPAASALPASDADGAMAPDAEPDTSAPKAKPAKPRSSGSRTKPARASASKPRPATRAAVNAVEDAPLEPAPADAPETADVEPVDVEPVAAEPTPAPEPTPDAEPTTVTADEPSSPAVLELKGLTKRYGEVIAADDVTLALDAGTFTGIVGPNGAGKTTTLSMITGLLRPTSGTVTVAGIDVWRDPVAAKRLIGVLPDRLHTFDRLTGGQLLYYTAVLHGLDRATARRRTSELAEAFRVEHAMSRLVTDYSSGMLKKIALAAALIHAPRLLVLDEPFESVDPVSAMTVAQILRDFVAGGGTVLLSSHSMELVQRICDHVAVIVDGRLIAGGTVDEVRGDQSLQERFIELAGSDEESIADLTWLHRFSG